MTSQGKAPEIIDLTEPDVIELDSDGEVVEDGLEAVVSAPGETAEQPKKKRKKRKKKANGNNTNGTPEEVSRPPSAFGDRLAESSGNAQRNEGRGSRRERRAQNRRDREGAEESERNRNRENERDKDRDRENERERDVNRERRRREDDRRSRSPRRETRRRSRSRERERSKRNPPTHDAPLFFEDVTPAQVPALRGTQEDSSGPSAPPAQGSIGNQPGTQLSEGLLLPAHVTITDGVGTDCGPLDVPTPEGSDEDEDYIDYLDYDDDRRAGMVRYWELDKLEAEEARASKPTRFVCKKCGAEGEHKTYECPVLICLTCGARDEHSTRSCPISKVCFTCGMKGHINKTCPNRGKHGGYYSPHDCDRCGARTHQTNECPTLWRMYKYVEDDVRQDILRVREGKRLLALGQGGEGYIATDEWCYNCGESGHLGDDCTAPHLHDAPKEHSAFSLYNILSGPFASESARPSQRTPRDWEMAASFADGHGGHLPMDVGKQGRKKERERLERRAREAENAEDDPDDWFGAAHSRVRSGGKDNRSSGKGVGSKPNNGGGGVGGGGGNTNTHIKFDFSGSKTGNNENGKRQRPSYGDLPGPSRETDSIQIRGASRKQSYSSTSSRDRYDRYDRDRYDRDRYDRDRYDRNRDRDRDSQRGPRYRGGYSR